MGEGHAVRKNDSRGVQCSCVLKSAVKRVCTLPWDARVSQIQRAHHAMHHVQQDTGDMRRSCT